MAFLFDILTFAKFNMTTGVDNGVKAVQETLAEPDMIVGLGHFIPLTNPGFLEGLSDR